MNPADELSGFRTVEAPSTPPFSWLPSWPGWQYQVRELDDLDDAAYEDAWHRAADVAETDAGQRIAKGASIVGTLLRAGHRMLLSYPADLPWPRRDSFTVPRAPFFQADPDLLFDISADDIVTVSDSATAEWKAKRRADEARRATAANRHGHNGAERNGYAVTTLTEGIS